jgi:hypothetical protein
MRNENEFVSGMFISKIKRIKNRRKPNVEKKNYIRSIFYLVTSELLPGPIANKNTSCPLLESTSIWIC